MAGTRVKTIRGWLLVGLLVLLSLFGVPALVSSSSPRRDRDDIAIVLMAGRERVAT